ncbi:MAG: type IV pilus modification PilV family protein [Candidatus Nealsonbacteria bacterium]
MFQNQFGSKPNKQKGISLIEILIVISIITVSLTSLLGLVSFSLNATSLTKQTSQANNIAQELIEQVRSFRDSTDWSVDGIASLTTGINYYIEKSGLPLKWQLIQGTETINGFTKKIVFKTAKRDGLDNIVEMGGTNDTNTKKITATVSWQERNKDHQIEIVTYLTNWK